MPKVERNQRISSQVSVEETIPPAEFCLAKFPCLMVYDFLANLLETGILCQIGDIAMHFAVHFYVFITSLR